VTRAVLLALFLCVSFAGRAVAQPVSDSTRAAARKLGEEANALFAAGDYAAALDKYNRADALVSVPTLGVRAARCLVKLGRLVEASERYLAVTRMEVAPKAPKVHREALADAEEERRALLPRIPAVLIKVAGSSEGSEVVLDGKPVPAALLGVEQPIDPGTHRVEVRRGDRVASQELSIAEGEKKQLSLTPPEAAPLAPQPATEPSAQTPGAGIAPDRGQPGSGLRTLGWVALGVGAVGVLAGTATGAIALANMSALDEDCPDRQCPPSQWDDVESYDKLRTYSTIGFTVGVVGLAAGTVLLLAAPSEKSARPATLRPWAGIDRNGAGVGLSASFR
jgi:hypothetical protein